MFGAASCSPPSGDAAQKVLSFMEFLLLADVAENEDGLRHYATALQTAGWNQTFPLFSDLLSDMDCSLSLQAFQGTTEPLASQVASLHARWHQVGCPPTEWPANEESVCEEGLQGSSVIAGGVVVGENSLMRNNFVEYFNSIMGNTFVEYQRASAFADDDF